MSDRVADSIRRGIITGELKVGQKISVNEICRLLEVSATPVKEAFKMLQAEGLLETKARKATTISDFAKRSLENTAIIRSALEGAAAHIAAQCISDADLAALGRILDDGDAAIERNDTDALVACNTNFHKAIREATHNTYLVLLIDRLVSFDYSFRRSALQTIEERRLGKDEHRLVFEHIRNHEPEAAEAALSSHIRRSSARVVLNLNESKEEAK